jgi:hypothetical protein
VKRAAVKVKTKPEEARHEKHVAAQLEEKRICTFLPLLRQTGRRSDRWSKVEVPMFSCYAFEHMVQTVEERLGSCERNG